MKIQPAVLALACAADAAARRSLAMARRQRELGAASQAELVLAQQASQETAIALVQARAGRLASTVALYQALGGGWSQDADAIPGARVSAPSLP